MEFRAYFSTRREGRRGAKGENSEGKGRGGSTLFPHALFPSLHVDHRALHCGVLRVEKGEVGRG